MKNNLCFMSKTDMNKRSDFNFEYVLLSPVIKTME